MEPKGKSKREFIFTSSFALKDTTSRLRSLAQRRHWKIDIESMEPNQYHFHVSLRHWIPLSVSGTLERDSDKSTLVTGHVDIHWLMLAVMLLVITGLVFFQWTYPLAALDNLRIMSKYWDWGLVETWTVAAATVVMILGQVLLAVAFYIGVRRLFSAHKQMRTIIETAMMDSITDLPQAVTFSNDDGELIFQEDENLARGKQGSL